MVELHANQSISSELDQDLDFGTEAVGPGGEGLFAAVNDAPIAMRLDELFGDNVADPSFKAFRQRFALWLVPHRVAIIRRSGNVEPTSVGIEVEYDNGDKTCSVVSLIPSFSVVERINVAGEMQLVARGALSVSGQLLDPPAAIEGDGRAPPAAQQVPFALDVRANVSLGLNFRLRVLTPKISAVGVGSRRCEWRFDRDSDPLYGRDVETWAVVALPKRQRELTYKVRFYYLKRGFFTTSRFQSEWVAVSCHCA